MTARAVVSGQGSAWSSVIDASTGPLDLGAFLDAGAGDLVRDISSTPLESHQLLVVTAGPADSPHGTLPDAVRGLARVPLGGYALVLLGWPTSDLETSPVAAALASAGFESTGAAATPFQDLSVALIVVRGSTEPDGASIDDPDDEGDLRRTIDDAADDIRTALMGAAAAWPATGAIDVGASGEAVDAAVRVAALTRERATLADSLRKADNDLRAAQQRIIAIEGSMSMRVGRTLVGAAKNPRSLRGLPRQAARMWRARGGRAGLALARSSTISETVATAGTGTRLLTAWRGGALSARDRPVVVGVIRAETASTMRRATRVSTAMPDDAVQVLDRVEPDLVVIETAVSSSSSPWAYLGDAAAVERERRLLALLDGAQAAGRPVVLWRNTPAHETASLRDFAARCDLVVDSAPSSGGGFPWSIGVELADVVASSSDAAARTSVLYSGGLDPRDTAPRRAALVTALEAVGAGLTIRPRRGGPSAQGLPVGLLPSLGPAATHLDYVGACRRAGVVIAAPFSVAGSAPGLRDDDLVALAAGARLVSGSNAALSGLGGLGSAIVLVEGDDIAGAVRSAIGAGPLTPAEHLEVLRAVFRDHTVAARMRMLVDRLGLDVATDTDRHVAVIVPPGTLTTQSDLAAMVASVLRQEHLPAEIALARGDFDDTTALGELAAAGVHVRALSGAHVDISDLAAAVDSAWIATWVSPGHPASWGDFHLLDLIVGAVATAADAVVLDTGPGIRVVDTLVGDAVLLRRSAVIDGDAAPLDLRDWVRGDRRLVAVGSGVGA